LKIVEVTWDDAHASFDETSVKDAALVKAVRTTTVAYLVAENDEGLVLATDTYKDDKDVGKIVNFIPWTVVIDYVELIKV
jgi:hypothetical protein